MKKKKVFALMMAATLALSLAGCGGSSSGDSKSSGSSDSSSVANKDKPLCWFNRQPSNSSTGVGQRSVEFQQRYLLCRI